MFWAYDVKVGLGPCTIIMESHIEQIEYKHMDLRHAQWSLESHIG